MSHIHPCNIINNSVSTINFMLHAVVDVGTTSIKAGIVDDEDYRVVRKSSIPAQVLHPRSGYAEQDPDVLFQNVLGLLKEVCDGYDVESIALTTHMAGFVPVDRDGKELYNLVIWLDERGKGYPRKLFSGLLKIEGYNLLELLRFLRATGGAPSRTGKDVLSKILWLRENEPDVFRRTWKFLDVKGYLLFRLTGNAVMSHDEANLTWLADTKEKRAEWHDGLMKRHGLNSKMLPEIRDSTDIAGKILPEIRKEIGLKDNIPVLVGAGDMCTAAIGSGAVKSDEVHIYIGTSDWIAAHVDRRVADVRHYVGTILSGIPKKYLLVAEQEVAGGVIDWVAENFGIGDHRKMDEIVLETETDLIFTPWFYGERAVIDDHHVRGSIVNLSLSTKKEEIIRAAFEGIALNVAWAFEVVEKFVRANRIAAVGGGARYNSLCKIMADALQKRIERIAEPENAGLRGLAVISSAGLKKERFEDAVKKFRIERVFEPDREMRGYYVRKLKILKEYYKRTRGIFRKYNVI